MTDAETKAMLQEQHDNLYKAVVLYDSPIALSDISRHAGLRPQRIRQWREKIAAGRTVNLEIAAALAKVYDDYVSSGIDFSKPDAIKRHERSEYVMEADKNN